MHTNMSEKIAIVTGGSSGIGAAIVHRFTENKAKVISIDITEPEYDLEGCVHFTCDLTQEDSVKSVFAQIKSSFPVIDVICANAGVVPPWSRIKDTNFSEWKNVIEVNINSLFLTLSHGARLLKNNTGTIVVTGSINSWKGDANISSYVASKHAALGLIRSAALDLGQEGIRVNGVAPGPIATDALISRVKLRLDGSSLDVESYLQSVGQVTALKRIATIDEVINTIEFLASEKSSGITGQLISVDCGI